MRLTIVGVGRCVQLRDYEDEEGEAKSVEEEDWEIEVMKGEVRRVWLVRLNCRLRCRWLRRHGRQLQTNAFNAVAVQRKGRH